MTAGRRGAAAKSRPSISFAQKHQHAALQREEGKKTWAVVPLAPERRDGIYGATETTHMMYFAVCHGAAVKDPYQDGVRLAKRLGYKSDPSRDEAAEIARPEDALDH